MLRSPEANQKVCKRRDFGFEGVFTVRSVNCLACTELIVKIDWVVQVYQLTAAQQVMLNHHPQMLSSPTAIIAALQLNGTNGNGPVS